MFIFFYVSAASRLGTQSFSPKELPPNCEIAHINYFLYPFSGFVHIESAHAVLAPFFEYRFPVIFLSW